MKQKLLTTMLAAACLTSVAYAQSRQVSGKVSGADGRPIAGVSVAVVGTSNSTQTDGSGNFSINVAPGETLNVSYIGYTAQKVIVGNSTTLSIVLAEEVNALEEIVVTGAGLTASRKSIGSAQTTLKAADIVQAKPTNVVTGLTGKVAGMTIQGVSSGVNPNYRVMLRGMRSLTGDNQALIVVDNVISPSSILGNLNPDDVAEITVLQGASSAALYGSAASNGAILITTKKGNGAAGVSVNFDQTYSLESISFMPKMQKQFGSGADNDLQLYIPYENQQYGPKFDGSLVEIGHPLADGSIQKVPYSYIGGKDDFWDVGHTSQTNFSIASTRDASQFRASGQYLNATGTVPGDKYERASMRVGGQREITDKFAVSYTANYVQNRYDQTTATSSIYQLVLNTPGQVPLTDYQDWRNNPYASPDGYYNAYYNNPYFLAANNRGKTRNDYLLGNFEAKYKPMNWLDFTGRVGMTTNNNSYKGTTGVYMYSDYTKSWAGSSTYKQQDILGSVSDNAGYSTNLVTDFIAHARQEAGDFKIDYKGLFQFIQNTGNSLAAGVSGLVDPTIFNLGNSINQPSASQSWSRTRTFGLTGMVDVNFRDYLFLALTGRNDWVSTLDPANRSFFYPSAALSFVPTSAFESLQDFQPLDFLKLRTAWSKVGNVNMGAYGLVPGFSQGAGFPYAGAGGFTISDLMIQKAIRPEMTRSFEVGFESAWFKNRITADFTYYDNRTVDNIVSTGVSWTTGYSNFRTNSGITTGKGIEAKLSLTPVRTTDWEVNVGANYSYFDNKVERISEDLPRLSLGSYSSGVGSYAVEGQPFPVLMGNTYVRDDQGRIIVDPVTGYPTGTSEISILGRAMPNNTIGLNLNVKYKNLSFYTNAEYRTGNYIYNAGGGTFDFSGAGYNTAIYDRERFVIPNSSYWDEASKSYVANTNVTIRDGGPGYWSMSGPRTGIAETYITSAAFWKIREMSLVYNIPQSWLAGQKTIKNAKISLQGRNLFLWTPSTNVYTDPEYSDGNGSSNGNAIGLTNLGQTPPSRTYGMSVSLTF